MWQWTLDFEREHSTGGGFGAYHINKLEVQTTQLVEEGGVQRVVEQKLIDEGRAWHSAYFEMLGEQGYPGLLWLFLVHGSVMLRMELIRRRYRNATGDKAWIAPLATALQHFQLIYMVGAVFVAIALTPFILLMLGVQTGFALIVARREQADRGLGRWARPVRAVPHPAEQPA